MNYSVLGRDGPPGRPNRCHDTARPAVAPYLLALLFCFTVAASAEPPLTNRIGMVMIRVPAGFWAGQHEVTQAEYEKVMGTNPSKFRGARLPVQNVNWNDAMEFCRKLTELERPAGRVYRLPTEKEWEQLVADATLDDAVTGRFDKDGKGLGPAEVGSRKPNQLGLYDIRGNMWEWCLNDYMANSQWKVLRGGAWSVSDHDNLAIGTRLNVEPYVGYEFYGFRCVLVPETPTSETTGR